MPSLADVVLAQDVEPDLEDEDLRAQLAELAELRAKREKEAPLPPRVVDSERSERSTREGRHGVDADALLSRAEAAESAVDKELEEMDRELQRQVAEFRKQQRRDSQPSLKEEDSEFLPQNLPLGAPDTELQKLKDLAAKMEEAFPEDGAAPMPPSEDPEVAEAEPEDSEVGDFKQLLDQLDLRLRALQSKDALKLPLDEAPPPLVPSGVRDVLEDLRAQNRHIREKLAEGRKGRLNLDRELLEK